MPKDHNNVSSRVISGEAFPSRYTFGPEVEVNYFERPYDRDGLQFTDGFSGWDTRYEPTADLEIVSPILSGAEGIAEVIETLKVVESSGATVDDNCGQHLNIGVPYTDNDWQEQMYQLFRRYYSLCYVVAGDMERYRLRGNCATRRPYSRRYGSNSAMEMRHPPATLDGIQFTLNLGLCLLLAEAAEDGETPPPDARPASRQGAHEESKEFFYARGWQEHFGLPYNVDNPPTIRLVDESQMITTTTTLPNRAALSELEARNSAYMMRALHLTREEAIV